MNELHLGPNGSLIYCFEFLFENQEWLMDQIKKCNKRMILIDLPGQIELYINSEKLVKLISQISKNYDSVVI